MRGHIVASHSLSPESFQSMISVDDLSHLPVCSGKSGPLLAIGKKLAKVHRSRFVHRVAKSGFAQRSCQRGKEMGGSRLIVPHVGTVAEAAADVIVHSFKSVELAIGSPEAGCRRERRKISAGGFLHHRRQSARAKGLRKCPRP